IRITWALRFSASGNCPIFVGLLATGCRCDSGSVVLSYRKKYTGSMEKSRADGHEFMEPEEWQSWTALLMLHRTVLQDLNTVLRRTFLATTSPADRDVLTQLWQRLSSTDSGADQH